MTDRLNLDVPYTNRLRRNLLQYEKNYNLNSEDQYDDDSYLYLPSNYRGGAINIHPDVHLVMNKLAHKYGVHQMIQGSGVWRSVKKGAISLAKEAYNKEALLATLKHAIWDNEYIMTAIKVGATTAVTALLATVGAPASIVAATPMLIAWTGVAINDYIRRRKKELKKKAEEELQQQSQQQYLPAPQQSQQALTAPQQSQQVSQPDPQQHKIDPSLGYGMYNVYRHNLYDIAKLGKEWYDYKYKKEKGMKQPSGSGIISQEIHEDPYVSIIKQGKKLYDSFKNKKGKGVKQPRKSYTVNDLDLRYQLGDVPQFRGKNYGKMEENNNLENYLGGSYEKPKRKQSDRQRRRGELVKKIMREKGYNLAQASKYIKVNNLQY